MLTLLMVLLFLTACWAAVLWPDKRATASLFERFQRHVAYLRRHIRGLILWALFGAVFVATLDWFGIPTRFNPYRAARPLPEVLRMLPFYFAMLLVLNSSLPAGSLPLLDDPVAPSRRRRRREARHSEAPPIQPSLLRMKGSAESRAGDLVVTVRDQDGRLVTDATVRIETTANVSPFVAGERAIGTGQATFRSLPIGPARIVVSRHGEDSTMPVVLESGVSARVELQIQVDVV